MRIGIDLLSERGTPGGIHTYTTELLRHLIDERDRRSLELELVLFAHADFVLDSALEAAPGVTCVRMPFARLPAAARRIVEHGFLPALARDHAVDLVHSVNNVLPGRLPVPGVVTVHDLSPFACPERFGRLKRAYLRAAVPASVRRARRTICVSRSTREQVLTWVPGADPARIAVVPEGVGSRFHPRRSGEREERLRARYRLPERFFLHLGLIEPGKNLEAVSRALEKLRHRGLRAPLVIAGRPTRYLAVLKGLWSQLSLEDSVHWIGGVASEVVPDLYRMARVFVFPSHHEGFGLPVLEALACGTPTVVSTRSSLPEVAGNAALQAPPNDPDELALAMERLWSHEPLRRLVRARGIERAGSFRWGRAAQRTLTVYLAALGRARSPARRRRREPRAGRCPAAERVPVPAAG